jgi:hypothetical protein
MDENSRDFRYAAIGLALLATIGVALIFIYPGSPEQDADYHFLMARTAWVDPSYLVNVWARPFFTTVFAPAAFFGFRVARFLALAIGVVMAWQTYRLARDLGMIRPWLVIPILLGQPVFFELFSDVFTEPLFALVFVQGLRWHFGGRIKLGMLAASFLPLARPEGVFLCLCWAVWVQTGMPGESSSFSRLLVRRLRAVSILATGAVCWWSAATLISRDPLFILHNWPATWRQDMYGRGTIFSYTERAAEFTGYLLAIPFMLGLGRELSSKRWVPITSSFLLLFVLHSVFRLYGLFGEAGYPRYMISVAPAVALLTLSGWNTLAQIKLPRLLGRSLGSVVLALSILTSFIYLDTITWARDCVAIQEMANWLKSDPRPFPRLIWSNARMCTVMGLNLKESPALGNRESSILLLKQAASGTMVFWDDHLGPDWFGLTSTEIEQRGYRRLRTQNYSLPSPILPDLSASWIGSLLGRPANRQIELSLLQKP